MAGATKPGPTSSPADLSNEHLPDILPDSDLAAIKRARAKGQKTFDSSFYNKLPKPSYGLPELHISHPGLKSTQQSHPLKSDGRPPYRSSRLHMNPDGSADVTVNPNDKLWNIAREALKENMPQSFRPSNESIEKARERLARQNHLSNDELIQPGRKLLVPKDLLEPQQGQGSADVTFEVDGASPDFVKRIESEFQTLPENERRLIKQAGITLVLAGKVTDAVPELVGVTPRGWPTGTTWDDADGLYQPGRKQVIVTETRHNRATDQFELSDRAECVMRHETGHGVDSALDSYSHMTPFGNAYRKDVSVLSTTQKQAFSYLLQQGVAGKEETFAEMFAGLNGCTANRSQTVPELNGFPTVRELVRDRLSQLP
jgi:hypothetical protein